MAIKQLGSNGGGFFNTNSATPFENPTPFTNFVELYAILLIPFAAAFTFGRMVQDKRQGRAVFAIMLVALARHHRGLDVVRDRRQPAAHRRRREPGGERRRRPGGNLEGKELRYGPSGSASWGSATTDTSNGSVNSMHDSYTPMGGGLALVNMKLGEVSPGGVGVGLNGLLVFVLLSVFIAGLMVGRTPEYLGKKIQAPEVKLLALYILAMPLVLLGFLAGSDVRRLGEQHHDLQPRSARVLGDDVRVHVGVQQQRLRLRRHHRHTEWMNTTLGIAMLVGRFFLIIPTLAVAGSLARKRPVPAGSGTFPTHTPLFVALVVGVIVIVGALTFLPVLALGPIVEQLGL